MDISLGFLYKLISFTYNGYSVFTDGSKTKTGTGSGVYISEKNIILSYRLPDNYSVLQAHREFSKVLASLRGLNNEYNIRLCCVNVRH